MAQPPLFDQILNKIHRLKGQADQHGVDADASARWEREMRDLFSSTWPPEICNAPNCPPALTYLQYKLYRIAAFMNTRSIHKKLPAPDTIFDAVQQAVNVPEEVKAQRREWRNRLGDAAQNIVQENKYSNAIVDTLHSWLFEFYVAIGNDYDHNIVMLAKVIESEDDVEYLLTMMNNLKYLLRQSKLQKTIATECHSYETQGYEVRQLPPFLRPWEPNTMLRKLKDHKAQSTTNHHHSLPDVTTEHNLRRQAHLSPRRAWIYQEDSKDQIGGSSFSRL